MTHGSPQAPTHIGPYRVLRPLGSGGMARVFAVEDPATGRHRAVKLLMQRGMAWARFEREYRALSRLDHPNIVRVFRYGVANNRQAYLLMELLDGLPVQEWVARFGRVGEPARTDAALQALAGVADALEYLHQRGYIHRDLKSNNVLVLHDGTAKLLDFGATRGVGPDASSITRFGEFVGTFTYASPEQIDGEPQDARSDVYSLGVLAYRLLAGRPPFEADSVPALTRMHFEVTPEPLHQRVPGLPLPVSQLVEKMLAKQPRDRVQSAGEVAETLRWAGSDVVDFDLDTATQELATSPPLLGRRRAMQTLRATVQRARPGRMVLVVGAPGAGRNRMLREAWELAVRAGMEPWRAEIDDEGALSAESPGGRCTADDLPSRLRERARPVALVVRELHRASPATLESMKSLRKELSVLEHPVLLFASLLGRGDSPAIRLAFMDAARVVLRPLTRGEVGALMEAMLGEGALPARTVNRVAEATGGQPGFVREMIQAMAERGLFEARPAPGGRVRWHDRSQGRIAVPPPIRRALMRQFASQPREALRPLGAVAMAGEAARTAVLAKALGLREDRLEATLEALHRRGLLTEADAQGRRRFTIRLAEQVLLDKLSATTRQHLEQRLAVALPDERPSLDAVRILSAAGRDEAAQRELVRCWKASRGGHELAQQLELVGAVVQEAVRSKLCPPALLCRLELCWTRALATHNPDDERVDEAIERARALVVSPEAGAEVELEKAQCCGMRGEAALQARALEAARALLATVGKSSLRSRMLLTQSQHSLHLGQLPKAIEHASAAMAYALQAGDATVEGLARIGLAAATAAQGDLTTAKGGLIAARAKLSRDTDGRTLWIAELELARVLRVQGRLSEALALLEQQLDTARLGGALTRVVALTAELIAVELDMYQLGEARERLAELEDAEPDLHHPLLTARLSLARGRLALAAGEPNRMIEALGEALSTCRSVGLAIKALAIEAQLGEALASSGDPQRGLAACERAVHGLRATGHLPLLAEACAGHARALGKRGDPLGCFRPVLPWLREQPMRLVRMEYLLTTAERATADGDARSAHYGYQDARALADELLGLQTPEDRDALRVHPWLRRIERGESQGLAWKGRR